MSARLIAARLLALATRRPRLAAVRTPAAPPTALRAHRALAVGSAPPRAAGEAVPLDIVDVAFAAAGLRGSEENMTTSPAQIYLPT